jgi:4-amino-4-deoxy-L-arabinose transferase-like glycosyltransferase
MKFDSTRRNRTEYIAVWGIVLLALAVRVALVLWADRAIRWDEPDYLTLAQNLVTGGGFTVAGHPELHYAPLFPAVAGIFYRLLGDLKLASDAVYVLAGAALVWPFYLLVRQLFGARAALASSLLLALCPALNASVLYWGTMTEPLYLLCVFAGLWFAWLAAEEGRLGHAVAAGVCFGLAYLTRPEGSFYALLGAAVLLVGIFARRRARSAKAWLSLAGYAAAAILVILPYLVYLHQHTGQWMVSGKLGVTYDIGQAVLARDPAEYDRVTASLDSTGREIIWYSPERFQRDLAAELAGSPLEPLRRVWVNLQLLLDVWFDITIFPTLLLVFVGLAWFAQSWDRKRLVAEAYWFAALLPLLAFLPFHVEIRFFAPALPIALAWVGRGALAMGDWAAATLQSLLGTRVLRVWLRRLLVALPTLLVAVAFVGLSILAVRQGERGTDFGHREAGLWLKDHAPADSVLMSRDLAIALYAEREWVPSPRAEMSQFLDYARSHGADYVAVDEREVTVVRPQLKELLHPETAPKGLRLVYQYAGKKGRTLVYALDSGGAP